MHNFAHQPYSEKPWEKTKNWRGAIFYCHECGDKYQLNRKTVGCGVTAVYDMLKWHVKTEATELQSRSRRPPPTGHQGAPPAQASKKNQRLCRAEVCWNFGKNKTGNEVSTHTLSRTLHAVGLRNCVARLKPIVSTKNEAARLAWCKDKQLNKWIEQLGRLDTFCEHSM